MTMPRVERPDAPKAYGYSTKPAGMHPWERVASAIAAAHIYWIGTVLPDGGPHQHPIWGGFVGTTLYFEGGPTTRWGRNLGDRPVASFGVESEGLHISGRGPVSKGAAGDDFKALRANYAGKYQAFGYSPSNDDFYRLNAEVIIAIDASSMEAFASSPTRFRFSR